jgi:hypothetical protein
VRRGALPAWRQARARGRGWCGSAEGERRQGKERKGRKEKKKRKRKGKKKRRNRKRKKMGKKTGKHFRKIRRISREIRKRVFVGFPVFRASA